MYKLLLAASLSCAVIAGVLLAMGNGPAAGPALFLFFALLALAVRGFAAFRGFAYTLWIFAAVTISMFYPQYFIQVGDFQLKKLIVPLLQLIMFGMGTAMSLGDFAAVIKTPRYVIIGVLCQFTIMPTLGFALANAFAFPPEIAAGVVLIGCAPSGLASNVMSYLAKANLALSITITALATLMSPFVTPVLMQLLGGQYVQVDVWTMMWDIIKMVIIPIVAGLVFNRLARGKAKWLDEAMPLVSMVGIAFIITIITAAGRGSLLTIGPALIAAAFLHNTGGYLLGYWSARLLRMDERSCRTVALEVGMQNGGLASAIALQMGKVATVGLAPAVFGPLMNVTGSALATWWGNHPPPDTEPEARRPEEGRRETGGGVPVQRAVPDTPIP
ncbi:MAG: Sodium-dependent transporter [uncultured Cytophagales bacterium]|uniref:Sodium-dependent transporter n=1 Tax=uncultured Cytophagales bacterium TaxID=158755 RepID=A0A6J4KLX3_9SPHI|nr:MAG: Sodium-dependent transporter [uncultured Cytophagales bacterium]